MNSTSTHPKVSSLNPDKNVTTQNLGVVAVPGPKSWGYMHRAKWARALPVGAGARLTAICIADHINEKSGKWILSAATIADETGQGERTVRRHINDDLRAYFQVEDRPGLMWRFTIPAPMMAVVEPPRPNWPDTPAKLADVPSNVPSEVHTPRARERLTCEKHGRSWPESWGSDCFECNQGRTEPHPERPKRTRKDRARPYRDSAVRSRKIDQARREWKRIESVSSQGDEG